MGLWVNRILENSLAYVKQYVGGLEGTGMEGRCQSVI
jgi:hypothetical protein